MNMMHPRRPRRRLSLPATLSLSVVLLVAAGSTLAAAAPGGEQAGAAPAATASDSGPGTRVVRHANQVISSLLRKKVPKGSPAEAKLAAQVTSSVRGFLDIDMLGRRAMRDHWAKLTPAQRATFMKLLKDLIERNYVQGLRANLNYRVAYTGEKVDGDHRVVTTEIHTRRHGHPYVVEVDYVLTNDGGHWRAFDVVTDGVGLVDNYRAQFNKIIARDGVDGLIDRMQKKRDQMD